MLEGPELGCLGLHPSSTTYCIALGQVTTISLHLSFLISLVLHKAPVNIDELIVAWHTAITVCYECHHGLNKYSQSMSTAPLI